MNMEDPSNLKSSNKLRIVGKIRGFRDDELKSLDQDSKLWITVNNPQANETSEKSKVSFDAKSTSRKDVYELDFCYEQDAEISLIYLREVKPLISEVFKGQNASFIALGAKGSGKTYTVQGSQEKPGLAVMAMADILSIAGELGKSVYVSLYELTQDHVYDLLDPKHPEVQVMEDAHGKINLKGLSQTPVKSISDFHTIYFSNSSFQKTQKELMNVPHNHKGLMVHISADDKQKTKLANKINFVDLTGYEDPKKSTTDGKKLAEINRTNKSLYALLNVISSLKANEIRLPYRESKLTRILQDSLGCKSHILLLACLKPFFCQDTISSMSLVSRSYRSSKQVFIDSTNRNQSTSKVKDLSSSKGGRTMSALLSAKNNPVYMDRLVEKKASSILKGRKPFDKEKKINSKEAPPAKSISEGNSPIESKEDKSLECAIDEKAIIISEEVVPPHSTIEHPEATHNITFNVEAPAPCEAATTCEENTTFQKINNASPPVSERIREISNKLKSFCSSTPLRIKMSEEVVAPQYNTQASHIDAPEPKTPAMELDSAKQYSPRGTFHNRSEGVKHSLVQEYLHFLNSASKEQLKGLKGIGEKRATYILELREESPEPFKNLDDLQDIGLSAKQIKGMMKKAAGELFN